MQHNTEDDLVRTSFYSYEFVLKLPPLSQWVIVDTKVYNLTRFKDLHPGGVAALLQEDVRECHQPSYSWILVLTCVPCFVAGQDATEAFYGLHRHEVLEKPQYQRLQIGVIEGEEPQIVSKVHGEISHIPYAEPTWLTPGYHSPYFSEVSTRH